MCVSIKQTRPTTLRGSGNNRFGERGEREFVALNAFEPKER